MKRKILGWIILAFVFGSFFVLCGLATSFKFAAIMFIGAFSIIGLLIYGIKLVTED